MTGTFTYSKNGVARTVRVRECPKPEVARAMLEYELGVPVFWRASNDVNGL